MSIEEVTEAQVDEALDMLPRGVKAIQLLVEGKLLVQRFMTRPGVTSEECCRHIEQVEFILGPLVGPSHPNSGSDV